MKRTICIGVVALLSACASDSGVVDEGSGTYYVAKQAATGFSGLGNLRAEVTDEARVFCSKKSSDLKVLHTTTSQPPFVLGNYPRVEMEFTCS